MHYNAAIRFCLVRRAIIVLRPSIHSGNQSVIKTAADASTAFQRAFAVFSGYRSNRKARLFSILRRKACYFKGKPRKVFIDKNFFCCHSDSLIRHGLSVCLQMLFRFQLLQLLWCCLHSLFHISAPAAVCCYSDPKHNCQAGCCRTDLPDVMRIFLRSSACSSLFCIFFFISSHVRIPPLF